MNCIAAENHGIRLALDAESLSLTICAQGEEWRAGGEGRVVFQDGRDILFRDGKKVEHSLWKTGVGAGIRSRYAGFSLDGQPLGLGFETIVWVENESGDVFFEWMPINEDGPAVKAVYWPDAFSFEKDSSRWYSLLNLEQGLLIPNDWPEELGKIPFDGQLCSCAAYMPWFGQVRDGAGYIAINETPWDAGYQAEHPAGGPYTHLSWRWLPTLGKMDYRRRVRYVFRKDCDYNTLCKIYRDHVKETGLFTTLAEKAARNPLVNDLIGAAIVHKGIKTHVAEDSAFYDPNDPEKNDSLVPFSYRTQEVLHYRRKGVEKLYLHLDGWGQPGYDNQHPDYLPACKEAGGWEGFKELSDTMEKCGYLFGIHDQYRDYYFSAKTFDREFGLHAPDGSVFEMARWAGGRQTYLCATQAPYYVKRNFEELFRHGIHLKGAYLDVFTCNEPDECAHPEHRMTRKECLEYRAACFAYLTSRGILPSSEEVTDWAMKELVFCHYGPYDFMLRAPGSPKKGVPVPLFNLVYHDCLILPWPMDHGEGQEDYMLYALINGGAAYLDKDGAYPGIDGAFDDAAKDRELDEKIVRYRIVAGLQEKVAKLELVRHEFDETDWRRQKSVFADGTEVSVNLADGSFEIR